MVRHNVVGWFEIPVKDMNRAIRFYEAVFQFSISRMKIGISEMAMFPGVENSIGAAGALIHSPAHYKPSGDGVLVYFTAFSGDVAVELSRVETAGGTVLIPKRQISPEIGYMGVFADTEGNRIALHSR